ncbi:MAG TPA: preprotein translocase subunit YajC [Acidimicrobiia bacterium]
MEFALLWLLLLVLAFFLLVVRPQRRQLAAHRALVASLAVGDEIISSGGIHGTIRAIDDDTLRVEIADGVVVRVARRAVATRVSPPPGADDGDATRSLDDDDTG